MFFWFTTSPLARYSRPVPRPRLLALMLLVGCDPAPVEPAAEPLVPDTARCEPVADWDFTAAEDALRAEIDAVRAEGGRCGALTFLPAPRLRPDPALRCAARLHSADMQARMYTGQVDPDGVGTGPRLAAVGYTASSFGENVGFTVTTDADPDWTQAAADMVAAWADNPTTCWKLHARELQDVGIGAAAGSFTPKELDPVTGLYWTATFAAP